MRFLGARRRRGVACCGGRRSRTACWRRARLRALRDCAFLASSQLSLTYQHAYVCSNLPPSSSLGIPADTFNKTHYRFTHGPPVRLDHTMVRAGRHAQPQAHPARRAARGTTRHALHARGDDMGTVLPDRNQHAGRLTPASILDDKPPPRVLPGRSHAASPVSRLTVFHIPDGYTEPDTMDAVPKKRRLYRAVFLPARHRAALLPHRLHCVCTLR